MLYAFPPEIAEPVRRRLVSGEFASEDDVLKAALRALDERDEEIAAIQAGIDDMESGRVRDLCAADAARSLSFATEGRDDA